MRSRYSEKSKILLEQVHRSVERVICENNSIRSLCSKFIKATFYFADFVRTLLVRGR